MHMANLAIWHWMFDDTQIVNFVGGINYMPTADRPSFKTNGFSLYTGPKPDIQTGCLANGYAIDQVAPELEDVSEPVDGSNHRTSVLIQCVVSYVFQIVIRLILRGGLDLIQSPVQTQETRYSMP